MSSSSPSNWPRRPIKNKAVRHIVTVLIGPTASGKSALSLARAQKDGGVVINADVMQLYASLPILTAQPTAAERAAVPHALYGVLQARDATSAVGWCAMARDAIAKAHEEGRPAYLTGGTGLYIKVLMEGFSPMPDCDPSFRRQLYAELEQDGLPALYAELGRVDPELAARLKPNDTQRIMRGVEVFRATGRPLSQWQALPPVPPEDAWDYHVIQIHPRREPHREKIAARLNAMMDQGVLAEVAAFDALIDAGAVPPDAQVVKAHGFRLLRDALKNRLPLEEAVTRTIDETRQYAKRQMTWLRHQIRADEIIEV